MQMRLRELAMAVAAVYAAGITPTLFPAIDGLSGISAAHAATSTTTQDAATLESEIKKLQAEIDALNQAIVDLQQKLTTNLSASQRQAVLHEIKKLERVLKTKQNQLADLQAQLSKLPTTEPTPTEPTPTEPAPTEPAPSTPTTPNSGTANPALANLAANTALALGTYNPPFLAGCSAPTSIITDYSRFTYDSVNHQILMFGGGHASTPRTDVDVLDLNTFAWTSAYASTPVSDMTIANFDSQNGSWKTTGHPLARHTLDLLSFAPNTGELILLTGVSTQPNCMELYDWDTYPGKIWHYNPQTRLWKPSPASPIWNAWPAAEYDPVSGKIVVISMYGLYTYDPATKVAAKHLDYARGELSYNQNLVYYPPTDTMYYIVGTGAVFEVKLDRTDYSKSTIVPVAGVTGTFPTGAETGWAYDPVNKIIGGGISNGVFYAFDPAMKTWTSRTMQVTGTSTTVGSVAFHALDYDTVNNVFIFQGQVGSAPPTFTTWAYRLGGTADPAPAPAPAPTPPPTTEPAPAPSPSTSDPQDFAARCSAAGVVRCVSFDSDADISGRWGANSGITVGTGAAPTIDAGVRASGGGSLKFTIPSNSGSDSSGSYFANFSNDLSVQFGENSEFFVQWRQRFSDAFINTFFAGNSGIKQVIINTGDTPNKVWASCEAIGNVLTSYYQERFTTVYNSCTGSGSHGAYMGLYESMPSIAGNLKLQNAMPSPYCTYFDGEAVKSPAFPAGCFGWHANEWMTFQVGITLGPRDNVNNDFTNSRLRMWVAREGQPSVLVIDWKPGIPGYFPLAAGPLSQNQKFGKIWLLPYQTTKDATQVHPTAYTWYDELIVSKTQIADPK